MRHHVNEKLRKFPRCSFLSFVLLMGVGTDLYAQKPNSPADTNHPKTAVVDTIVASKDEKNRNVMLNAANNSGPRVVNVGLPSNVGGTTILENDLPVVYSYWPELPNRTWRGSTSLAKTSLISLREAVITTADFGYAVSSYTRTGGNKFELNGNVSGSQFGWIKGDVNASGPIKNNWYYTTGVYANFDPQAYKIESTRYADNTKIFRLGFTKRFNKNKGEISLLYKYGNSAVIENAAVFRYQEGGKIEELDNFQIGKSSYIKRDGTVRFLNTLTGDYYESSLKNKSDYNIVSHNIDIIGNYQLPNKWKLKFAARFHSATASNFQLIPSSIKTATAASGFTYADGTSYVGPVQIILASHLNKEPLRHFLSRVELTKKQKNHHFRIGATGLFYNENTFAFDRSFFYQEVGANPRQLYNTGTTGTGFTATDQYGYFNYNLGVPYHAGNEKKITGYFSDEWIISSKLSLTYGVNLRYQNMQGNYYALARPKNFTILDKTLTEHNHNWWHKSATANVVYKITKQFGVMGDFIYNERHGQLQDYAANYEPSYNTTKTPYASVGVYLNHPKISIVSAFSYVTRNAYNQRYNLVNPNNVTEAVQTAVQYDIKTTGWTTDIVAKPFRNFELHYLLTIQNPIYQNYVVTAFGNTYDFSGKNVIGISKVLQEIDPSFTTLQGKLKLWASVRSFSKQFANQTNVLFFKGWWETFAGVNYKVTKTTGLGITVVNPLNQRGAKGTINGAELITNPEPYYGQLLTSTDYIMPFMIQAVLTFKL